MAMIDAARAQQMLGCDEATFSNYINSGTLRSQRVDGQLMVEESDVMALVSGATESSDSILVLDSESDDLSIDLGDPADGSSATLFDSGPRHGTDQITFGDELEAFGGGEGTEQLDFGDDTEQTVSFDDSSQTLSFDDSANTEELSFTESNTAVLTDVDDTMSVTATSDYQTVDDEYGEEEDGPTRSRSGASSVRRSVRAERVRQPVAKVSPAWLILLILLLIISAAVIAPFYLVSFWPKENVYHYNGDRAVGIDDNAWANMAAMFVGFDVEPHPETWRQHHPDNQDPHRPLAEAFPEQPNIWRYQDYRGRFEQPGQRATAFMITRVEGDMTPEGEFQPRRAVAVDRDGSTVLGEFQVRQVTRTAGDVEIQVFEPEIVPANYR